MGLFDKLFGKKQQQESLQQGLQKTREGFFSKITKAIAGKSTVDEEVLDELENALVSADVGIETTVKIIEQIEKRVVGQREVIDHLAVREVNHEGVARFLTECYVRHFGAIADNPQTDKEWRDRQKAVDSINSMLKRFERELGMGGATAWNALNAYTGWLQHDRPLRVKEASKAAEARLQSNLFGTDGDRAVEALGIALAI